MKSESSFINKYSVLFANCLFLLADIGFLTFIFLDGGGEIVFCHDVVLSRAYGTCADTVQQFYIPLLIFSGVIAISALSLLIYTVFASPGYRELLKKFLRYFIPSAILLLLLGLIPIDVGLGFLGSVTIFLFIPFLFFLILIFIISIYYFTLSKKRSVLKYLIVVIVASGGLTISHLYLISLLESIANHDGDLDNTVNKAEDCHKFWYERYEERCLEDAYKRSQESSK